MYRRRRDALDRWPTNLGAVPAGSYPPGDIYPHGALSLSRRSEPADGRPRRRSRARLPGGHTGQSTAASYCPGDVTASADLSHFVFATSWNVFAPGGQLSRARVGLRQRHRPGTVTVASKTPGRGKHPATSPADQSGDPLQIPAYPATAPTS